MKILPTLAVVERIQASPSGRLRVDKTMVQHGGLASELVAAELIEDAGATVVEDRDGWTITWGTPGASVPIRESVRFGESATEPRRIGEQTSPGSERSEHAEGEG